MKPSSETTSRPCLATMLRSAGALGTGVGVGVGDGVGFLDGEGVVEELVGSLDNINGGELVVGSSDDAGDNVGLRVGDGVAAVGERVVGASVVGARVGVMMLVGAMLGASVSSLAGGAGPRREHAAPSPS
jgi:hypothetical protein